METRGILISTIILFFEEKKDQDRYMSEQFLFEGCMIFQETVSILLAT